MMAEREITWEELQAWQQSARPHQLVDVREDFEREIAHIGGRWIPLGDLVRQAPTLDEAVPLVFYCRKGVRSLIAIQRLQPLFPDRPMYSLRGGMEGLPSGVPMQGE